ncbi:MAG: DUF1415 domain-containing protein [Bacteroidota bacterium]|nr:DUF1415 domain-containing protein [Bacteroidota bacterium]MDP3145613.1 DUF1415 domain-containing protein [Bacteroidota bacterium]
MSDSIIIDQTQKWIKSVVIDLNFCPFAAKAMLKKSIHYIVLNKADFKSSLEALNNEIQYLNENQEAETSFIIFPNNFTDFEEYLDLIYKAEEFLEMEGYEGVYQLASFHPDYCFEGSETTDAANYTNRSVFPMLHILREDSITKAIELYKNPELIPEHNIKVAREKGLLYMQMLRSACFNS